MYCVRFLDISFIYVYNCFFLFSDVFVYFYCFSLVVFEFLVVGYYLGYRVFFSFDFYCLIILAYLF